MSAYLRNAWYVAGFTDEFAPGRLVARTLLGVPRVLFRTDDGAIAALADLHAGTLGSGALSRVRPQVSELGERWTTRNFAVDPQANAHVRALVEHAFSQQDKPRLEAQQRRIGERKFGSLNPVLRAGDAGAVRVRRQLQRPIGQEQAA